MTEARFSQIYQLPMILQIKSGLHHKLRAIGLRTMATTYAIMPFQNVIYDREGLIEAIGVSRRAVSSGLKIMADEKIIALDRKIIRVRPSYCTKNTQKNKRYNWFKLNIEAIPFINHSTLGFYEQSVILAIFAHLKYGNEFPLNISQTAKVLGIPKKSCSRAFKALLKINFIYKFAGDNSYYLNPIIAEKGCE